MAVKSIVHDVVLDGTHRGITGSFMDHIASTDLRSLLLFQDRVYLSAS